MDDAATFTSDTASMKRRILLEQLMTIRSLMRKEGAADDDDSRDRDVINYMKKGMTLNKEQLTTALSTEFLLTVLLDVMLLRLMDEGEEGGATSPVSSDRQQAAAAKKKQKAAAKKKRYKRNKAAAKHKKINLMSWLSGGIISVIMMVAFSFITTPIVTLSLFQPSDGSGDGKVPPALPPSASKSLRQDDMKLKNEASTLPDIIVSPLAAVVPPPIFAQTAVSNRRRMKSDEMRESTSTASAIDTDHPTSHNHNSNLPTYSPFTPYPAYSPINLNPSTTPCLDTPNWKDGRGNGCDWYREYQYRCVFSADNAAGYMGSAKNYCCICGGGSHSLPPTNSPTITSSPTKSTNPSSSPSSKPSSSPTKSANPSSYPSSKPSSSPTQFCMDTPNWEDKYGWGCDDYRGSQHRCSYLPVAGDMGSASTHCCICDGGINSFPPSTSLKPSSSPTKSANPSSSPSSKPSSSPTQFCMDTPNWESVYGEGCDFYQNRFEPGCPVFGNKTLGEIGSANEHCCHCGGGSRTCQDFRSKCQDYFNVVGIKDGALSPLCKEAESCSCEATDHAVKIDTYFFFSLTVGLYNECKCNFWTPLCEDKGVGEACDYAAEYCCGDYMYDEFGGFQYLNSPTCYCDFFTYAQDEFGHKLEPKALNISEEFDNACSQIHSIAEAEMKSEEGIDFIRLFEKPILETIYIETNGENWTNSAGWMNETVDHCQWYGITCDSDSSVTSIDLRDNNLSGQFPIFTRNEFLGEFFPESDWIPDFYNLKTLDLADNKLTGTINYLPLYNLYSLTHFDVSGNQLSGEVDALVTPSLTYADFSSNRFSSMRRFEKYKVSPLQTLRFCDVSNNTIQNDVTVLLENIPPNIEQFFASNNIINGNLPASLNSLSKLSQFDMSSNALSGSLLGFTESLATLQKLDMSNQRNGFVGLIPDNIWRSLSLEILNLADNRLTGSIPSLVGKMTALEEFDLSNNNLTNVIPSELGKLDGTLQLLGLSNNALSGIIPAQIGQLQGASIFLKDNRFDNSSTAPLSLCLESEVNEFDLKNDTTSCPIERNALSDFYDSTKGAEWTDSTIWLAEYGYCDWHGVTCDDGKKHVTNLTLANNGLSGRLRESIGELTFIEKLDLSDNDIKASIPTEIGLLSELTYLRLSYNAFTGTAPGVLGELANLQLLQLQSNRITKIPDIIRLDDTEYGNSAFVTDCGVPSAFDKAPKCKDCTMCCNANDDCYPQEDIPVTEYFGLNYVTFAAVFFAFFVVLCCLVAHSLYLLDNRKYHRNSSFNALSRSVESERRIGEEDDNYALSRIGKNSVYSYFVTDKPAGWLIAFATLGIQTVILVLFIMASEANLQDDAIDIEFTWKCPRDSDRCDDKADWTKVGWFIFCVLMIAFLSKDMVGGCKLIYHSSKIRHTRGARNRYLVGGTGLCSITVFALYVSTVYNRAIATNNTDLIVNSVVVLFIMDLDEWIFFSLEAINEKWTEHAADAEVSRMKEEIARQRAQLASQQKEIDDLRDDLRKLCETVELQRVWSRWEY